MPTNEKKGVTVKIDAELHAEVRQYIEDHNMTMGDFVTLALQDELHPKLNIREDKNMGNMRTMAFQVPEELFQKIKDYLQRNHMTQKEFVIGLIENEINRDLAQRVAEPEQGESAAVCERVDGSEPSEGSNTNEQAESDFEGVSGDEYEETEDEDLDDEQDESEDQGMSMGM